MTLVLFGVVGSAAVDVRLMHAGGAFPDAAYGPGVGYDA
jgi:hypothetical protein